MDFLHQGNEQKKLGHWFLWKAISLMEVFIALMGVFMGINFSNGKVSGAEIDEFLYLVFIAQLYLSQISTKYLEYIIFLQK